MKPRVSDEMKAALLARVYTDLMPKPPPKPKARDRSVPTETQ